MVEEKMVERELLADGIRIDGVDYVRGDTISITEKHAKVLESHGSVGAKGSVKKAEQAKVDAAEAEARHQRYLSGLADPDGGGTSDRAVSTSDGAGQSGQAPRARR